MLPAADALLPLLTLAALQTHSHHTPLVSHSVSYMQSAVDIAMETRHRLAMQPQACALQPLKSFFACLFQVYKPVAEGNVDYPKVGPLGGAVGKLHSDDGLPSAPPFPTGGASRDTIDEELEELRRRAQGRR